MVKISAITAVALAAVVVVAPVQAQAGFGSKLDWSQCTSFGFTGYYEQNGQYYRWYCGPPQGDRDYCFQTGQNRAISDWWCDRLTGAFLNGAHPLAPDLPAWKLKVPNEGYLSEVTCLKKDGKRQKEVYKQVNGQPTGQITQSSQCWPHTGPTPVFALSQYPDWTFGDKPKTHSSVMGRTGGLQPCDTNPEAVKEWQQCYLDHSRYLGMNKAECEYGYACTRVNEWWSRCMEDPDADHECCHSENEWGCTPGSCCAGLSCLVDQDLGHNRCVRGHGLEPSTGIPGCTDGWDTQKSVKTIYARCFVDPNPWSAWDTGVPLKQGDCAHGLVCMGGSGLGEKAECHPDPAMFNPQEAMNFWETACRPGDCRPGSFCKQFYRDDGSLHFTQCRWGEEKGCMRVPGNSVGCDAECANRSDCLPVHDGIVSIPDLTRSYHEKLGTCVGAICSVWGDPHIVSCDNKKWDCQAEGLFTYMKNPMFDIQTHFVQLDTPMGHSASITNAIVIDNKMIDAAPKVQFMFPPMEDPDTDVYPAQAKYIGSCPVMMHIDGQMIDISSVSTKYYNEETEQMPAPNPENILYQVPGVMKAYRTQWSNIMVEYTDTAGVTSTIMIKSGGSGPHTGWSCIFSLFVCLPGEYESLFKTQSTGLAGTPDGNYRNDWIKPDGTVVEYGNSAKAFEFCTTEYCVGPLTNKLTPAPGKTFNDYKCQDQEFHECTIAVLKNDLGQTDASIMEQCGVESMDQLSDQSSCIVELCANGEALQDEEDEVDDINENGNPEDPQNPEDVDDDCEDLGAFLSEATGPYAPPVPPAVSTCSANAAGYDQSHSVLVGKDYHCMQGIGMEGSLVVMDDMIVDDGEFGCSTFVTTTDGSCVHPETGSRCIQVGDSITLGTSDVNQITIMQDSSSVSCHTVYKGSCSISGSACTNSHEELEEKYVHSNGELKQDLEMDLSAFATELQIIKQKQAYWSTWHPEGSTGANGVIEVASGTMTLKEGPDHKCEQVFNLEASDFDGIASLKFHSSLNGKTILINIAGANPTITMPIMFDGSGYTGIGSSNPFSPTMSQSILWNFFGSENGYVTLDGGIIQGSIAVAGDLIYKAKAHLGRLIVQGNLVQDAKDAVFLNYPFNPTCPLPLPPDADSVCTVNPPPVCVETTYRDLTSDEACPNGAEVVTLLSSKGVVPDAEPIIYGIEMIADVDGSPQVKFKIDNPFDGKSDIYVKYGKKVGNYGLDPDCDRKFFVEGCDPNAYEEAEIIAGCTSHDGIDPYAIIHVYFASKDNEFADFGGEVDRCCHAPDYTSMYGYEVYEFSFEIKCACPTGAAESS
jgi:choice-of-anchor A domain-containing protein